MNYCDDLIVQAGRFGDKEVLFEVESGEAVTFSELLSRVSALAVHLLSEGVGPGSAVCIHLCNSIDAAVMHLATQYVGARSCLVDALVQPKSLDYYIDATEADILATHLKTEQLPPDLRERTTILEVEAIRRVSTSDSGESAPPPYDWPEDECSYIYFTSGTTSTPKGVMLSPRNHANFTQICDAYWRPVDETAKHISYVPFSHGFGTVFLLPLALRTASELHIMRAFHPLRVVETIARHGITHIYGVPSHYQQLLRFPDGKERLRGLKMAFCAAAKLEHDLMLKWEEATGTVLCEGYGLIETCCGIVWRVGTPSLGTGHMGALPDESLVEIAILDEAFRPLRKGETGQIAVKGKSVMLGYLGPNELTVSVMHNGWFLTGDKGHVTEDNQLFMTGRIKDIINIAGIKVSPYEVEAVLLEHPNVEEAAVVPAPDPLYGEVVKAFVRKKANQDTTERDLIRFAAERLINFQVPKRIDFVESFPVNNMGKLDRKALQRLSMA